MKKLMLFLIIASFAALPGCEFSMGNVIDELTKAPLSKVIYYSNGADNGIAPEDDKGYREGDLVTVLDNIGNLEKSGSYYFTGWNTESDGNGTTYTTGETFTIGKSDISLYARWQQGTFYSVTYNANGGSGEVPADKTYYESGRTVYVKNSGTLYMTGYTFGGWTNGGSTYTAGDSFTITSDTVLTAKWEGLNTYTVTYFKNGGTGDVPVDTTNYLPGAEVNVLANTGNLYLTGYVFAGWTIGAGGTVIYTPGSTFFMGSADIGLYAKWGSYNYTVTFNSQNADTAANPSSKSVASPETTIDDLPSDPVRSGYTFGGWWENTGGGGDQFLADTAVTGNMTVYALWNANSYSIVFNSNGGTGTMGNQTAAYGSTVQLNSNTFTLSGYVFTGWASASGASSAEYSDGGDYTLASLGATLYAIWIKSGAVDSLYNNNGSPVRVVTAMSNPTGNSAVIQPDGRIILAGTSGNYFALVRYNNDGSLDTTFGTGGIVTTTSFTGYAGSAALQSDGKIVVAGAAYSTTMDFAVARYNSDGTLDTTFGTNGITTADLNSSSMDCANAVALQSDGKIVLAGYAGNDIAVVRYNADGTLDTGFNSTGIIIRSIASNADSAEAVVVQPGDGKIVIAGYYKNGTSNDIAVLRYNSDGTLDTAFGSDGIFTTPVGTGNDQLFTAALQSDGKILVGGSTYNGINNDFLLARLNANGSLDSTFNSIGMISAHLSDYDLVRSVLVQTDGRIVTVGSITNGYAIHRWDSDGSPDSTFGSGGSTSGYVSNASMTGSNFTSGALQSNGELVISGVYDGDFVSIRFWM